MWVGTWVTFLVFVWLAFAVFMAHRAVRALGECSDIVQDDSFGPSGRAPEPSEALPVLPAMRVVKGGRR